MKDSANHKTNGARRGFFLKSASRAAAVVFFSLLAFFGTQRAAYAADFTVSSNADSGAGTLRAAIDAANSSAGTDRILFSSSLTIQPLTPLPVITGAVIIDASGKTVELSGAQTADSANATTSDRFGLQFAAGAAGSTVRGLIINHFGNAGIKIAASNTTIVQNVIGTNASGAAGLGNVNSGILIVGATNVLVGGTAAADRNIISGNQGTGVSVTRGGSAVIVNNYIGVASDGATRLGNTRDGVFIGESSNSSVGGTDPSMRNIISGNIGNGVYIAQDKANLPASGNVVAGNYIGVNTSGAGIDATTGRATVGNNGGGIVVEAGGNIIGGNSSSARNVIAGNGTNGIALGTSFATGNVVAANFIGVASDGTTLLRNRLNGVQISNLAFRNTIGGSNVSIGMCDNACNVISSNGDPTADTARAGVYLDSSAGKGNAIRRNSIFSNTELGIDLAVPSQSTDTSFVPGTGATPNDANDPDDGPNSLQNFPVLSAADTNGSITGTLNSTPNATFVVDFYRNLTNDNEAQTYIGSQFVRTDANGNATVSYATPATLAATQFVTATATSASGASIGDTSEVSASQQVVGTTAQSGGLEADVFTRPNGNGILDANDESQVNNFFLGIETPATTPNEFQRADCFPFNTRGDGKIDANDVAQARNYQLGIESPQAAGGPTQRSSFASPLAKSSEKTSGSESKANSPTASRDIRVVSTNGTAGNQVTVMINTNAVGNESFYGYSINFDPTRLMFNSFTPTGGAGGVVTANTNNAASGQLGFSLNFSGQPGGHIAPGNNQNLMSITFTVRAGAPNGTTAVTFGSTPTRESVSDSGPPVTDLTPDSTFTDGAVTIGAAPTAAAVTVKGRVTAKGRAVAGARVSMTDVSGKVRVAATSSFGYYQFTNVPAGETYVFKATARRYEFPAQVVNVNEEVSNLNFAGK